MPKTCLTIHLLSLLFLFSWTASAQAASTVFLSEIQIAGEDADDEFIELSNPTSSPLSLSGWSLRKKTKGDATAKGTSLKTFGSGESIPAHGFFLWANSQGIFKELADTTTGTTLTNDNSLGLFDKDGVLIDSFTWGSGHTLPFVSTSFPNPDKNSSFARDHNSLVWSIDTKPTPINGRGDTLPEVPPLPPDDDEPAPEPTPTGPFLVRINEVLPNPKEKGDAGEFIELYNFGDVVIDLSDWTMHDATKTGKYTFPAGTSLAPHAFLILTDNDFTFALNNTDEALSLFDESGGLVHSVSYSKTKEGVSLNLVNGKLRGSRKPTPGETNSENTDPETKERVPKKGFKNFPIEFRARGTDHDGDALKFTWDFGDDHKSYKEKTTHKYEKTGVYTVILKTDDGIDTTEETFEIKIEKYEPPKLRIVAWMPNPKGKDSKNEWIEIENREKKSVNLKDFSIATGSKSKKLTNHPIRDAVSIGGKSTKRLTREDSLFTLVNTKGKIELRAPDGTVIHSVKYKFEKSLVEDVVLKKEKGKPVTLIESVESEVEEVELLEETASPALEETVSPLVEEAPAQESETTRSIPSEGAVLGATTDIPSAGIPTKNEGFLPSFFSWFEAWNAWLNNFFLKD